MLREFEWQALLDLKQWGRELSDRVNKLELAVEHKERGLQYLQAEIEKLERKDEQKETDWKGLCLGYRRKGQANRKVRSGNESCFNPLLRNGRRQDFLGHEKDSNGSPRRLTFFYLHYIRNYIPRGKAMRRSNIQDLTETEVYSDVIRSLIKHKEIDSIQTFNKDMNPDGLRIEYMWDENFTVAIVYQEEGEVAAVGVAKRNPNTDRNSPTVARQVSTYRAMRALIHSIEEYLEEPQVKALSIVK